jgi:hypothetical protein
MVLTRKKPNSMVAFQIITNIEIPRDGIVIEPVTNQMIAHVIERMIPAVRSMYHAARRIGAR